MRAHALHAAMKGHGIVRVHHDALHAAMKGAWECCPAGGVVCQLPGYEVSTPHPALVFAPHAGLGDMPPVSLWVGVSVRWWIVF